MRRLLPAIFLLLVSSPLLAQYDRTYTFQARSEHFVAQIEVKPVQGALVQYDVRIRDIAANKLIAQSRGRAPIGSLLDQVFDNGRYQFVAHLDPQPGALGLNLDVMKNNVVIETLRVTFDLKSGTTPMSGEPMRVTGDVVAPVVTTRVDAVYTDQARRNGTTGTVTLELVIDENGRVRSGTALKELPDGLTESAMAAARQWRFQPATLYGQPVPVYWTVSITFPPR